VLNFGETPAPRPFRRRSHSRMSASPAGAKGTRPAVKPLPTAGRAASDSLLHEVEHLLAGDRELRTFRQRSESKARQPHRS